MQLPQNKADRQKVLALIGVGVLALLYGIWAGIYNPIQTKKKDALARISELQTNVDNAEAQISRIPRTEDELRTTLVKLMVWSDQHMLYPRLGNYLLPVRETLGLQAERLGLNPVQVDEIGLIAIPRGPKATGNAAMQIYAVRVSTTCSYEELRNWFSIIEQENPLVAAGNLMITAQRDYPLQHQVSFELHYPVWSSADYHNILRANLASLETAAP